MQPYGSIIIPTFDRASTLGLSIQSALWQTEAAIEVLVVGDGCSADCRAIARHWAAIDRRVRFLDWPKAPLNGGANRDRAVREAKADRIFYSDDDDLLLPHHVATLGSALDGWDVVDTPVVGVRPDGRVDLGLHDSADGTIRSMLARDTFKAVFDTHLAHTKNSYLRLGAPWASGSVGNAISHMLDGFASVPSIRWRTIQRLTALSFHGARRVTMSDAQRRTELQRWMEIASRCESEGQIRQTSSYAFHASRLALALHDERLPLSAAIAILDAVTMGPGGDAIAVPRQQCRIAADLSYREPNWSKEVEQHLVELLGGTFGATLSVHRVIDRFVPLAATRQFREVVEQAVETSMQEKALAVLMCDIVLGLPAAKSEAHLEDSFATCPGWDAYGFAYEAALILSRASEAQEAAASWCDRAIAIAPVGRQAAHAWRLRGHLAQRAGDAQRMALADAELARLEAG